jgi:NADH-quinone oxidoreductase subunit C
MATVLHSAPRFASNEGVRETLVAALGAAVLASKEEHGEIVIGVARESIEDVLRRLRDEHGYQQLMEMAGVDYPDREERFEVVYMLLSLTKNHRIMVKVRAAENTPVPTVTTLWPNAGWLEREVFDLYGVLFEGNTDLRRILTDYGFEGHPFRKDFPLPGAALLRRGQARGLPAGRAGAGLPPVRLHEPVGRRRLRLAGRREGRPGACHSAGQGSEDHRNTGADRIGRKDRRQGEEEGRARLGRQDVQSRQRRAGAGGDRDRRARRAQADRGPSST